MNIFGTKESREISRLKIIAKNSYLAYSAISEMYDCGSQMLETFRPKVRNHRLAFNDAMDKLSKLDPNCPQKRL